jgi:hypothetical protein
MFITVGQYFHQMPRENNALWDSFREANQKNILALENEKKDPLDLSNPENYNRALAEYLQQEVEPVGVIFFHFFKCDTCDEWHSAVLDAVIFSADADKNPEFNTESVLNEIHGVVLAFPSVTNDDRLVFHIHEKLESISIVKFDKHKDKVFVTETKHKDLLESRHNPIN